MKRIFILCTLLVLGQICSAQEIQDSGNSQIGDYQELTDTKPHDGESVWERLKTPVQLSWGSIDMRYKKLDVPKIQNTTLWRTKAWKGERVNAQAVLWTKTPLEDVTVTISDLKSGGSVIPASAIVTSFVRYVMTDELNKDGKGGCGHRPNAAEWDSSMVADVLDVLKVRDVEAYSTQPVWMNVRVPSDVKAGKYKGVMTVSGKNFKPMKLRVEVEVLSRTLPEPKDWKFHLDLWQNPYSVARYHDVPLWSDEHFELMLPVMKMLAEAGQKVVTATIMHKPWAGQTEDYYDNMIFRMKKMDGSWEFDYTVFDKWVEFMMNEVGIDDLIACYTMIPWALSFDYFDQATNRVKFIEAAPGDDSYSDYWGVFLTDFSRHLREKGWFEKVAISMDERPMPAMKEAIKLIKDADAEFKITLAGHYHSELQSDLHDLSLAYGKHFPADVKATREKRGQISTVYVCCTEPFPNTFTFSDPAEASWIPMHAVAGNYDGLLRWSYNSWTSDALRDSRFRSFPAGDCYIVYPEGRSSIRFERLIEGIQDAEKVRVLRAELAARGAAVELKQLNDAVSLFTPEGLAKSQLEPNVMIWETRELLNSL